MNTINNIGQKIKGQAQQIKGEIEDATGSHVKGKVDQLRGKANEFEADLKMKAEKELGK